MPHIGIAQGIVTAGYVGTPIKYNASVFGKAVTIASRCASIKSEKGCLSSIVFPSSLWKKDYELDKIFEPQEYKKSDDSIYKKEHAFEMEKKVVSIKNIQNLEIIELINMSVHLPSQSADERAKDTLEVLYKNGLYRGIFRG